MEQYGVAVWTCGWLTSVFTLKGACSERVLRMATLPTSRAVWDCSRTAGASSTSWPCAPDDSAVADALAGPKLAPRHSDRKRFAAGGRPCVAALVGATTAD
jgi:hypothetical protein